MKVDCEFALRNYIDVAISYFHVPYGTMQSLEVRIGLKIECPTSVFGLVNYAVVFADGNLFEIQLLKSRKRLELLLEDLPCDHDPWDYYETSDQLLEPLLLCYDSLVLVNPHFFHNPSMHLLIITI